VLSKAKVAYRVKWVYLQKLWKQAKLYLSLLADGKCDDEEQFLSEYCSSSKPSMESSSLDVA